MNARLLERERMRRHEERMQQTPEQLFGIKGAYVRECPVCKATFKVKKTGPIQKYCTTECKIIAWKGGGKNHAPEAKP